CSKLPPFLFAGVKHQRLSQLQVSFTLKVISEELAFHFSLKPGRNAIAEVNMVVDALPGFPGPVTVRPGPHDNTVCGSGTCTLDGLVNVQRTVQVFGIKPASYRKYRVLHVLQVRKDASLLPELIVVRMVDDLLPEEVIVMKLLGDIFQRSLLQM